MTKNLFLIAALIVSYTSLSEVALGDDFNYEFRYKCQVTTIVDGDTKNEVVDSVAEKNEKTLDLSIAIERNQIQFFAVQSRKNFSIEAKDSQSRIIARATVSLGSPLELTVPEKDVTLSCAYMTEEETIEALSKSLRTLQKYQIIIKHEHDRKTLDEILLDLKNKDKK